MTRLINSHASVTRDRNGTSYFLNEKEVTRKQFILPAAFLSVAALATIAVVWGTVIYTIVSIWENNLTGALVGAGLLFAVRAWNYYKKPVRLTFTAGSLVRLAGAIALIAGIWHHSPVLIILGIILSIKVTFSTK